MKSRNTISVPQAKTPGVSGNSIKPRKLHFPTHQHLIQKTQDILKPIYEELLERCLGSNTQNDNESFNACVWRLAPKHVFCGKKILEIATYTAACIFNEGQKPILKILEVMGCSLGPGSLSFAENCDNARVQRVDPRSSFASKNARIARREARAAEDKVYDEEGGTMYGPGIGDQSKR